MSLGFVQTRPLVRELTRQLVGRRSGYDPDATALFVRFTTPANDTRKAAINALILALKAAGVWTKLDVLHVYAAHDAQAARQNWIGNFANATAVGGPTFTTDRGYAGNGSSSYLNLNFNPGDGGTYKFLRDVAAYGVWNRTASPSGGSFGFARNGSSEGNAPLMSVGFRPRVNQSANGVTLSTAGVVGHFVGRRNSSTETEGFENGSSVGTNSAVASTAIPNETWALDALIQAGSPVSYSDHQMSAFHAGERLTNQNITDLRAALLTYMQAVGAA